MRPIKFRAYLKDSAVKKMKNSAVFAWSRMMLVNRIDFENKKVGFERINGVFWFDLADIELMHFTGLHDKNGKEIWEGDIFQFKWDGIMYTTSVAFRDGAFQPFYDPAYRVIPRWVELVEVLGNIYENGDLLK